MSNPDLLTSLANNASKIAQNDLLKALLPVIDQFLTNVQKNEGGTAGIVLQAQALGPELIAALPNAGNQVVKDEAGAVKAAVDAEAAKLAAGNDTTAAAGNDTHAG